MGTAKLALLSYRSKAANVCSRLQLAFRRKTERSAILCNSTEKPSAELRYLPVRFLRESGRVSIASALGFGGRKVRYAIVGLGDIAQEAMMPGVAHTGNSEITALVSGDREKLAVLGERYGVTHLYDYADFGALIASGEIDAVYLATPNWRHAEFAVPALEAGVHVLSEKPLEISSALCRTITAAAARGNAKLMTAYRLHFEPATLDAIRRIRAGELGELIAFTSCFGQMLDPNNHRANHGIEAGPLFDMAPYPINAIRYVLGAEPEEVVSAVASRHPQEG